MTKNMDFSGVWHSEYTFTDPKRGPGVSRHDVKIYQTGNQLVLQSIPNKEESYLVIRVSIDGYLLTGTWQERTSPTGNYKGALYYGALQFKLEKDDSLVGKWVALGSDDTIHNGEWKIVRSQK